MESSSWSHKNTTININIYVYWFFTICIPTETGWCLTTFNHSGKHNPIFVFNQRSSEAHHCQNATIEELAAISEVGEEVLRQETETGEVIFRLSGEVSSDEFTLVICCKFGIILPNNIIAIYCDQKKQDQTNQDSVDEWLVNLPPKVQKQLLNSWPYWGKAVLRLNRSAGYFCGGGTL